MPDNLEPSRQRPSDSYMLGEMAATIRSIDANVVAMRVDIGDLSHRLAAAEHDITTIKADRAAMLPEYVRLTNTVRDHITVDANWKSRFEGGADVAKSGGKVIYLFLGGLLTIGLWIGGQVWANYRIDNEVQHTQQPMQQRPQQEVTPLPTR